MSFGIFAISRLFQAFFTTVMPRKPGSTEARKNHLQALHALNADQRSALENITNGPGDALKLGSKKKVSKLVALTVELTTARSRIADLEEDMAHG